MVIKIVVGCCCLLLLTSCLSVPQQKEPKKTTDVLLKIKLQQQLALIASDDEVRGQFNHKMNLLTRICQRCHGADGHSRNGSCPNLAGQNVKYLVRQLQHFSDDRRHDFQMQSITKGISDDYKVAIAIYFSNLLPRPSAEGTTELSIQGEAIFKQQCVLCHGANGQGLYQYPRLAGQIARYISFTLHEFKKREGRRQKNIMHYIAAKLSKEDITALAAYISRMK
jgi:cytochrome c553